MAMETYLEVPCTSSACDKQYKQPEDEYDINFKTGETKALASEDPGGGSGETAHQNGDDDDDEIRFKASSPSSPIISLRGREVIFAIATFFLFSVVIGLVVVLATSKKQEESVIVTDNGKLVTKKSNLCLTVECLHAAARILENMNTSADPCQDFWNYACGGWYAKNPIPPSESVWGIDKQESIKLNNKLRALVESPLERTHVASAERKAKLFYSKCMDEAKIDRTRAQPIVDVLNSLGGWAIHDDWNVGAKNGMWSFQRAVEEIQYTYLVKVFFNFWTGPDDKSSSQSIIQFDTGQLGLRDPRYFLDPDGQTEDSPIIHKYKRYMRVIAKLFNATKYNVDKFVNETFAFEKKLAEVIVSTTGDMINLQRSYNKLTLGKLQKISPRIDWIHFLQRNFSGINESTEVLVANLQYVTNLSALLDAVDPQVLNYYTLWSLVSNYAQELSKPFRMAAQKYRQRDLDAPKLPRSRWKFCLGKVDETMGLLVGSMFVRKYFSENSKRDVREITDTIHAVFIKRLESITWMDMKTKRAAIAKAKAMKYQIGFSDFLLEDKLVDQYYQKLHVKHTDTYFQVVLNSNAYSLWRTVDGLKHPIKDTEWDINPQENNAFYSIQQNLMAFPAAILQPPFYEENLPAYIKYGARGTTIGHEMTHGFDTFGSQYDKDGNLHNWWSEKAAKEFSRKTQCIIDYYSSLNLQGHKINGEFTVGENTADIGGLIYAFKGYKLWERQHGPQKALPGLALANINNDKAFFLAYGMNWCTIERNEILDDMMMTARHLPARIRLRGSVSQMPQFGKTFGCARGSPHRPYRSQSCSVW